MKIQHLAMAVTLALGVNNMAFADTASSIPAVTLLQRRGKLQQMHGLIFYMYLEILVHPPPLMTQALLRVVVSTMVVRTDYYYQ
ncbi:hypothetical protein [Alishewanella longhuensis]